MRINFDALKVSAFFIVFLNAGCSTFEVRNAYHETGKNQGSLDLQIEGAQLRVDIDPDTNFYSVGLLGAPVVPMYAKKDAREITLRVGLILWRNEHNFSFNAGPCLLDEKSNTLCPYLASVFALGMYQDDGSEYSDKRPRWQKIQNFLPPKSEEIELPISSSMNAINRERVYQYYGYAGLPKWDMFSVDVIYKYRCPLTRPDKLTLNSKSVGVVEESVVPKESVTFEKKPETDYRGLSPVQ